MRFIVGRFTSFSTEIESFPKIFLYSMKIKVQTRKLAAGCSKHCFEDVDEADEASSKHGFEVADRTDEASYHIIYGKASTWFEEIFEDY
ncbi:N-ethylammeline chlorohydrolase [Streptococcus pneumoniae]|nr:N-ethylammeline chlorohydrolase [Streptococcus pneumoniae]